MNMRNPVRWLYLAVFCLLTVPALAQEPDDREPDGREIMTQAYNRADGQDRTSTMTMTLINKRGSERVRKVESWSKDYGPDRKSVMVFDEPADVRGTAYLSWDYAEIGKDDDKWLYMPAMKKVRRISGSSRNEYFMGTDFTYDDMGKRAVAKDTHTWPAPKPSMATTAGRSSRARGPRGSLHPPRGLGQQDRAHDPQSEYYDKDGLVKVYNALDFKEQDGFWTLLRSEMDNVSREHKTVMEVLPSATTPGLRTACSRFPPSSAGRPVIHGHALHGRPGLLTLLLGPGRPGPRTKFCRIGCTSPAGPRPCSRCACPNPTTR
jgi:hypothetical protein